MIDKIFKNKQNFSFWMVVIAFVLPIVLATLLYMTRDHWSLKSKTYGELLDPPLMLPADLHVPIGLWQVLYIAPICLGEMCRLEKEKIVSVHEATGKDFNRVRADFVATTALETGLYIVDPQGYVIL